MPDFSPDSLSEQRRQFFLALSEHLRTEQDERELTRGASELLGRLLGVHRVAFAHPEDDALVVEADWTDGSVETSVGRHHFTDTNPDALLRGEARTSPDITLDDRIGPDTVAKLKALQIASGMDVPIMRDGVFTALLTVHSRVLRDWTQDEINLAEEAAERTWAARERLRAEGAEKETRALLDALLRHAPVGIYVKDQEGRYLLANPQMGDLMGQPVEAVIGRTAADLLDADFAAEVARDDRQVLEEARPLAVERRMERPGAPYEWTLISRFPIQTRPDGPVQIAGFDIDISGQKRAEAELLRSQEALYQSEKLTALGSLLAGVSHELNNPLSIVVAQSEMMELQAADTPLAARAAEIRVAAERCAKIVQTFLAMARHRPPERRSVDINAMVDTALALVAYNLRSSGVRVERELGASLPPLWADADQLHQVIINLVINAQQAMQEQSGERRLTIRTSTAGPDHLEIEVEDNGPGIPDDIRRRIFEPFFTTKAQGVGTGVGLSFSMGLVEAHGGTLRLEDNGSGARFRIRLPMGAPVEPADTVETVRPSIRPMGRRTALVVDDEPGIARALAEYLELDGYECDIAGSGAQAMSRLQMQDYDLVVSDLRMPDMDGPALFAWIRAQRPELADRVCFATGDTLGDGAAQFLAREQRPFIEKPFTLASVRRLLGEVAGS